MADEWYATLDADTQAHAVAKGWTKAADMAAGFVEAAKGHQALEKLVGVPADQVLRLPKDATDPTFQAAYDRIAGMIPARAPEDYKFDGINLPEPDQKRVRDLAVKHKLPPAVALDFAADLSARTADAAANATAAAETTKAANAAHLRMAYGADHDLKLFSAGRAIDAAGLPSSIMAHIATLPAEEYRKGMDALVALGQRMNERPMHQGTGMPLVDPTAGMTPEQAQARLQQFSDDPTLRAKFTAHDSATRDEWMKLTRIVASGRVPMRQ
mgnify:CR=1 FL=1